MTVAQLIEQLQAMPQDLPVGLWAVGYVADIDKVWHDTRGDVERVYVVEHQANTGS